MKKQLFILVILFLLIILFLKAKIENKPKQYEQTYKIKGVYVPESIDFAGEKVPLENFDVYENLEREILVATYFHSQTVQTLKRTKRYFPLIENILKNYNVPEDFKFLCIAESNLTQTVSPKQAAGFWQLLESTAIEYGLEVNEKIDERYNIKKSTEAACKYLIDAYKQYGSWTLAAAAFNFGRRAIDNQIKLQKTKNYYDMYLNEETSRYIYRALAYKIIINNPEQYGFFISEEDYYKPLETTEICVDSTIRSLVNFANEVGTNYKLLRSLNLWIRDTSLYNEKRKTYCLDVLKLENRIRK